jgi:hypothetical protein
MTYVANKLKCYNLTRPMFAVNDRSLELTEEVRNLKVLHNGRILQNIRLDVWKLPVANTTSFSMSVSDERSFKTFIPSTNVIKLFSLSPTATGRLQADKLECLSLASLSCPA